MTRTLDEQVLDLVRRKPRKTQSLRDYFSMQVKEKLSAADVEDALKRLVGAGKLQCVGGVWRARGEFVPPANSPRPRRDPKRPKKQTHFGWD